VLLSGDRRRDRARAAARRGGAQGAHKLARGYRPVPTYSAHHFADPRLGEAVAAYLAAEREAAIDEIEALDEHSPFRKG
jgi:predicted N-acyltransferase